MYSVLYKYVQYVLFFVQISLSLFLVSVSRSAVLAIVDDLTYAYAFCGIFLFSKTKGKQYNKTLRKYVQILKIQSSLFILHVRSNTI